MMQAILIVALAVLIAWGVWKSIRKARRGGGCCGERESAEAAVRVADRNKAHYPHEVHLTVGGMTCANCARRVENALNLMDGTWASVQISTHQARLLSKQMPDERAIRQAVQQAGYVVTAFEQLR